MKKFFSTLIFATLFIFAFAVTAVPTLGQNKKSDICHKAGDTYNLININNNAIAAHTAHGDAMPGMPVPNMSGYEFGVGCEVSEIPMPDFFPFFIRNNNSTIAPPWDIDMLVSEDLSGAGFSAATPRGGQKVGYGTNYFDGRLLNTLDTVSWVRLTGDPARVAYLNIWVTDGNKYAIISSENNYVGTDFATRTEWKVFEYDATGGDSSALDWLCASGNGGRVNQYLTCDGTNATLSDLTDVMIKSPTGTYPSYVGTGAPRGGYGFNLIWGDTSTNFLGAYSLNQLSITFNGEIFIPTSQDAPTN